MNFGSKLFCLALLLGPVAGHAQDYTIGAVEFATSCAQCHGPDGRGDGVMVGYLNVAPPDLSTLQKDNGGVFPVAQVFEVINGGPGMSVHGTRDMPAWGMRYNAKAPGQLGEYYSEADREAYVRGRILALVEYISTLQED